MLREWRHQRGYTDPEAAAALGIGTSTFCRWKNYSLPDELLVAGVVHRIRQGDDLAPVCVGAELALKLKDWRARHGLNQVEAAHALGLKSHAVRGIERADESAGRPPLHPRPRGPAPHGARAGCCRCQARLRAQTADDAGSVRRAPALVAKGAQAHPAPCRRRSQRARRGRR